MKTQIKILFVCHGNICRSPMAEFVMKNLVNEKCRSNDFFIASAATSTEELGNPVYPPARRVMEQHGLDCRGKYARRITRVLKLASALDRSLSSVVTGINCDILGDSVIMKTEVTGDANLEISAANDVGTDFRKVFRKNLEIL